MNDLGASQLAFSLLAQKEPVYIFTKEVEIPCILNRKFISCWFDAYSYNNGVMVATDIESAKFALKLPVKNVLFYIWDLEWLRNTGSYIENLKVFQNINLKLVARSEEHASIIKNYCNRNVEFTMSDCDVTKIKEYYERI